MIKVTESTVKIPSIQTHGHEIPVTINRTSFSAQWAGEEIIAPDYEALKARVAAAVARHKIKVEVPFVLANGYGDVTRCVATGLHGANGNVMYRTETGGAGQITHRGKVLGNLTDYEIDQYKKLARAAQDAQKALRVFDEAHQLDINAVVRDAVAAQVAGS